MNGCLYLIPIPLGSESDVISTVPPVVLDMIKTLHGIIAESRASALAFLSRTRARAARSDLPIRLLNEHSRPAELDDLLSPVLHGENWGLMSDAGCPAIADPGAALVHLAHRRGARVVPLPGPSAPTLALMASGLNGQKFAFHGYLSRKPADRRRQLKDLESDSARHGQTVIWMETPYRNMPMLEDALAVLSGQTVLSVATDLTLPTEEIVTRSVSDWKAADRPDLKNRPAVFLIGRPEKIK